MANEVSESRFHMWRTLVALVHADQVVTSEEKQTIENYLSNVSFSEAQKAVLREDLETQQDIDEMFDNITSPEDLSDFFQFARIILWCDGDYDAQERKIFEHLKSKHMERLDRGELAEIIQQSRESSELRRLEEERADREEADRLAGIGRLFRSGSAD